jgi:hypothetical protein
MMVRDAAAQQAMTIKHTAKSRGQAHVNSRQQSLA